MRHRKKSWGFTLIELLIVLAIVGTIAGIGIPSFTGHIAKVRVSKAIAEIQNIAHAIEMYRGESDSLPSSLNFAGCQDIIDPWGNPYQYLNFEGVKGKGKMRKNRFLVPINSDYDLYSMGADGSSKPPLTAKASRDDIIRANDGAYIGPASGY